MHDKTYTDLNILKPGDIIAFAEKTFILYYNRKSLFDEGAHDTNYILEPKKHVIYLKYGNLTKNPFIKNNKQTVGTLNEVFMTILLDNNNICEIMFQQGITEFYLLNKEDE